MLSFKIPVSINFSVCHHVHLPSILICSLVSKLDKEMFPEQLDFIIMTNLLPKN